MIYIQTGFFGKDRGPNFKRYDLEHPRVLWNSVTRRGTAAASTEAAGFEAVNALTPTTGDWWKPSALPADWTLTFDAFELVSAVAIDTHTIGSSGATLTVEKWDGAAWVSIMGAVSPVDDEPIAFLFTPISIDRLRISIDGPIVPYIGVIHISDALELPQMVFSGVNTPIDMALETKFENTMSAKGQYLGRSIRYEKKRNSFTVAHLKESWVRESLMPFIKDARSYPYFILERPYSRPESLSYRWMTEDIQPVRMGTRSYMSVSL